MYPEDSNKTSGSGNPPGKEESLQKVASNLKKTPTEDKSAVDKKTLAEQSKEEKR